MSMQTMLMDKCRAPRRQTPLLNMLLIWLLLVAAAVILLQAQHFRQVTETLQNEINRVNLELRRAK